MAVSFGSSKPIMGPRPGEGPTELDKLIGQDSSPQPIRVKEFHQNRLGGTIAREAEKRRAWQGTGLGIGNAMALRYGIDGPSKSQDEVFESRGVAQAAFSLHKRAYSADLVATVKPNDAGTGIKVTVEDEADQQRFIHDMSKRQTIKDVPLRTGMDGSFSFDALPVEFEFAPVMMNMPSDPDYGHRERAEDALIGLQEFARNINIWSEATVTHGEGESVVSLQFKTELDRSNFARQSLAASKHEVDVDLGENNALYSNDTLVRLQVQTPLPPTS